MLTLLSLGTLLAILIVLEVFGKAPAIAMIIVLLSLAMASIIWSRDSTNPSPP